MHHSRVGVIHEEGCYGFGSGHHQEICEPPTLQHRNLVLHHARSSRGDDARGRDFEVVDAKTDEDITHNVLTQIIMEEEQRGALRCCRSISSAS